jgi:MFS family permease
MRQQSSSAVEKKNFMLNFVEGALFSASAGFMSAQTMLPALVMKLGGSNIEVGAVGVITTVGLFLPQIFAARYVETHAWKKPWAVKYGLIQRIVVLLAALAVLAFGQHNPTLALWSFLGLYALSQIMLGVTTPGWFEMFAKMVPVHKRGRLSGIRSSLGGVGAFLCGIVLTWYLTRFEFPLNFSLAIISVFVLQGASIVVQLFLIETEPSPTVERKPFFAYMRQLPNIFRDNIPFRNFILATLVQIVATMPVGFFTVYALQRFSANETIVGAFTLAIVAVQVVSSLGIGALADKFGNRLALIVAACALFLANVWAMFAPSLDSFVLVFIFLGINLGAELLARYNIAIEYGPPEQRALYIGVMNTVVAPFYGIAMVGGAISNAFGYAMVFLIGSVASFVGIVLMLFIVREPRTFARHLAH